MVSISVFTFWIWVIWTILTTGFLILAIAVWIIIYSLRIDDINSEFKERWNPPTETELNKILEGK